jgi:AcrR family transcriptional regulator
MAAARRPPPPPAGEVHSRRRATTAKDGDDVRTATRQAKADILAAAEEVRKAAGSTRSAVAESKREARRIRAELATDRRARGRRQHGDDGPGTWQRIVDVATTLFTDQGYDGTSLREIADQLGFTKAALYYHFESKEEILRAILEPTEELLDEFMERLEDAGSLEGWADALEWVIDQMAAHAETFRLLERNRASVEVLAHTSDKFDDHQAAHLRVEAAVKAAAASEPEQIRMIAALAAVTGFDDWGPTFIQDLPIDDLQDELKAITRQILGVPAEPPARGGGQPSS